MFPSPKRKPAQNAWLRPLRSYSYWKLSLPADPGYHTGNCPLVPRVFSPSVFSPTFDRWLLHPFEAGEVSRPPAHVFERHLFILKMQMCLPQRPTGREKRFQCGVPALSASHPGHWPLNSGPGEPREEPTIKQSRLNAQELAGRIIGVWFKVLRRSFSKEHGAFDRVAPCWGLPGGEQDHGARGSYQWPPSPQEQKAARLMRTLISVKAYQLELIYISDEKGWQHEKAACCWYPNVL